MNLRSIVSEYTAKKRYSVASLFAGAGGLDLGFENSGFDTVWANDIDKDACITHKNWSDAEIVQGDISQLDLKKDIPATDVILGGFPCQGFSLAGPRKIDDKRNSLYRHFVQLVDEKRPYAFVAENVKGILTLGNGEIIEAIIEDFSERGYDVTATLLNAADYSVPQDRWRVILTGFRKDLEVDNFSIPSNDNFSRVTLASAIGDMPEPDKNDVSRAPFSPRYMSRNRRRDWDQVSYTIPAMSKQVTLHPSSPKMIKKGPDNWVFGEGSESRRFSWQEAAAVQTFPAEMNFYGNLTSKYKQIGNAVPVQLASVVARSVHEVINSTLSSSTAIAS